MPTLPSAMFFMKGEIWEKEDPPTKKQKNALRMAAPSYFPVSILSTIKFLPYQNPKAYMETKTKMIAP